MAAPTWSTGEVLYAADVNAWFVPLVGLKTSDLGRTGTNLVVDPDLQFNLAAGAQYEVNADLFYKCSGTTSSFQWSWTVPTGSTAGLYHAIYKGLSGGDVIEADMWTDSAHQGYINTANFIYGITITGSIGAGSTGGTFGLNWAAYTAGNTITLCSRSHLTARRIG